jgi:hypothetical protein
MRILSTKVSKCAVLEEPAVSSLDEVAAAAVASVSAGDISAPGLASYRPSKMRWRTSEYTPSTSFCRTASPTLRSFPLQPEVLL